MSHEKVGHSDRAVKSKSKAVEGGSADNAPFRGYINLSLSPAEKEEWGTWSETTNPQALLDLQCAYGINVSVKREKGKGSFLASATQRDPESVNAGLVVTARGGSAWVATTRVLYCLAVLDRTERWEDTQPLADPDRW